MRRNPKLAYEITVTNRTRQRLQLAFFRSLAARMLSELRVHQASVAVLFIGSLGMANISEKYRKKRKPTSVLSFPYTVAASRHKVVGDIVLCVPCARREAKKAGVAPRARLAILLLHAMVHLAGYTHDTEKTAKRMEQLEQRLAKSLRLPI